MGLMVAGQLMGAPVGCVAPRCSAEIAASPGGRQAGDTERVMFFGLILDDLARFDFPMVIAEGSEVAISKTSCPPAHETIPHF